MIDWLDPASWWLVVLGWSVLVSLCHTSAIALAAASWRLWRRGGPAAVQYRLACAALLAAVLCTLVTPGALLRPPSLAAPAPVAATTLQTSVSTGVVSPVRQSSAVSSTWQIRVRETVARAVPWIGAAWCVGFIVMLARLGGGWALAQWIRRRAVRVASPAVARAAAAASQRWRLPPAALLCSAHVEAPTVIGARAPAVLVPVDLEQRLQPNALEPLLAHEFAHVARGDYAANLLQSLADALLFFSPGAWWLSRRIRDAREFCCDDLVAASCGAGTYVSALTTLALLGVSERRPPAINVAGPRLIVRIRRLLHDETAAVAGRRPLVMAIVLVTFGAGAATGAVPVWTAALSSLDAPAATTPSAGGSQDADVPFGYLSSQPGAALNLRSMERDAAGICGVAEIENLANVNITAIRFAAFAYARAPLPTDNLLTASYATSDLLAVVVPPRQRSRVAVGLLSREEARERMRVSRATVMCAVAEIHYANGGRWQMSPGTIFGPERAEIPRAMIGRPPTPGEPFCRDETGHTYSLGAVAAVRLEPMTFTRCVDGAWRPYDLPRTAPAGR